MKAEQTVTELKKNHRDMQMKLKDKVNEVANLDKALKSSSDDGEAHRQALVSKNDLLHQENLDISQAKVACENQLRGLVLQLQEKADEKELLQTRHDALTLESDGLQVALASSQAMFAEMRGELEQEKEHSLKKERLLQQENNNNDNVSGKVFKLQSILESERTQFESQRKLWEHSREQAQVEKNATMQQTRQLEVEVAEKTSALSSLKMQLLKAQEDAADNVRKQQVAQGKTQGLEDELEILQNALEDNANCVKKEISKYRQETDYYRLELLSTNKKLGRMEESRQAAEAEIVVLRRRVQTEQEQRIELQNQVEYLENQVMRLEPGRKETDKSLADEATRLQSKLREAQNELSKVRARYKELELKTYRIEAEFKELVRNKGDESERVRDRLEAKIHSIQAECDNHQRCRQSSEQAMHHLRTRIEQLEKDLKTIHDSQAADHIMTNEGRDLYKMIKSAKFEAEDLSCRTIDSKARTDATFEHQKDPRTQVQRLRRERNNYQQKSSELTKELNSLQVCYKRKVDELVKQRQKFDEDQRTIAERKSTFNSQDTAMREERAVYGAQKNSQPRDKKHAAEIRCLAKQIEYLRARLKREQGFRDALTYGKTFLLMQMNMFQAW